MTSKSRSHWSAPIIVCLCLFLYITQPLAAQSDHPPMAATPPLAVGAKRPTLDVNTLQDGKHLTWSDLRGKVAVIDFWATWCPPCIASFPKMNALSAAMAGKPVTFLSVSYETRGQVQPTLKRFPLKTTIALDNDFKTFESFNAWGIPAAYVFDKEGKLAAVVYPDQLNEDLIATVLRGEIPKVEQEKGWGDPKGAEQYFRSLRQAAVQKENGTSR